MFSKKRRRIMARRITIDDIRKINELYYKYHNYAEVARQTGWSASTVRAYVDKNYNPLTEDHIRRFDPNVDMKDFDEKLFVGIDNYGDLCVLSDEENEEIKELWGELIV
jgi:hypothetical protein